ncbi:uncharacterized protein LOC127256842 [Andrographis paniculata]|uniref:uncharacterized protein LOC127256842 n=1 Tax=Andrographis paniculata TaxID=175694 RepID=UPI0021E7E823|nr:uncharacterized protein LOC127256842 [Andrographis paniculata]
MGKKSKSSKRKQRESEVATEVFPDKSIVDKDGTGVVDDLSEPTMGEKLATLKLEESEKAPNEENVEPTHDVKPPSADSVHILLKQALRADDRALLLDCISRQDEKVIANSLSLLNPSDVLKFLQALVPIVDLRGAVLACALPWLKTLLLQHAGSIISQEQSLAALNSLYQLIEARVSTFSDVLQLSCSLDLLYAESMDDGVEENETTTVPFIYEDDDDSDDEGSMDSMEVETVEDGEEPRKLGDDSDDEDNGEISD